MLAQLILSLAQFSPRLFIIIFLSRSWDKSCYVLGLVTLWNRLFYFYFRHGYTRFKQILSCWKWALELFVQLQMILSLMPHLSYNCSFCPQTLNMFSVYKELIYNKTVSLHSHLLNLSNKTIAAIKTQP